MALKNLMVILEMFERLGLERLVSSVAERLLVLLTKGKKLRWCGVANKTGMMPLALPLNMTLNCKLFQGAALLVIHLFSIYGWYLSADFNANKSRDLPK